MPNEFIKWLQYRLDEMRFVSFIFGFDPHYNSQNITDLDRVNGLNLAKKKEET